MVIMAKTQRKNPTRLTTPERMEPSSRRQFLKRIAFGVGSLAVLGAAGTLGVRRSFAPAYRPRFLTQGQFEIFEAACERILPTDSDPGAKAMGAAIYIDRLLAEDSYTGEFLRQRPILTEGLDSLETAAKARYDKPFTRLGNRQQDTVLGELADPQFLTTLVRATLDGVLYDPFYGGNHDGMGWRMIQFSPTVSFQSKGLTLAKGAASSL
jgi:gluconate 2-dehydrogenase gamma chain